MTMTHMELINPTPEMQAAVAAVVRECGNWMPTVVPDTPPVDRSSIEAGVCGFVRDPNGGLLLGLYLGVFLAALAAMFVWMTRIHRLPVLMFRLARRALPALMIVAAAGAAQAAPAYVCKMLPLSPGQLRDTSMLPPVLSTPGGAVIGRAAGIVYATAPERVVRGYQEVIGYGGRRGWVEAARLAPYRSLSDPRATCPAPPWSAAP